MIRGTVMEDEHNIWGFRGQGGMSVYQLVPMRDDFAHAITHWRYGPPYTMYDLQPGDEDMLMDPALQYRAVLDDGGGLAGFACFGEDAQVHGGSYGPEALDIGFGMAPERTGQGHGGGFVTAVCRHARTEFAAGALRLSVATFNHRAIAVYRRLGFCTAQWFIGTTRHGALSFVAMVRPGRQRSLPLAI